MLDHNGHDDDVVVVAVAVAVADVDCTWYHVSSGFQSHSNAHWARASSCAVPRCSETSSDLHDVGGDVDHSGTNALHRFDVASR
jgi:hypothetical protein